VKALSSSPRNSKKKKTEVNIPRNSSPIYHMATKAGKDAGKGITLLLLVVIQLLGRCWSNTLTGEHRKERVMSSTLDVYQFRKCSTTKTKSLRLASAQGFDFCHITVSSS
jgi:hypothetical protein